MDQANEAHRSKQNGLQVLRIVAAVLVLVHHATAVVWSRCQGQLTTWGAGAFGVDLFFVLSGFVMVYSSGRLAEFTNGWAVFGQRRVVRIVPMYWLATTVILCAMVWSPRLFQRHGSITLPAICSYFFLPSRDFGGGIHPLLAVGWTLNFEMFFYLLFLLALLLRINVFGFIGSILVSITAISFLFHSGMTVVQFYLDPIILEFFFGMLLARMGVAQARWKVFLAIPVLLVAGIVLLWPVELQEAWRPLRIGLPATAIVWSFLALEPVLHRIPRIFLFLANASYAIYLFHVLLMPMLVRTMHMKFLAAHQQGAVLICVIASLVLGGVIHHYVEAPVLRWFREHWVVNGQKTIQVIP